ncbi:putative LPS assembly protein LptD [Arcicella rigui]|uniref:LPS assembly protein LptD n=1 Tax=Arcicella rigui TaxID=797020 RepID=A0ABU5QC90_9BACT|nr:putative LPS assembly protein LptD [Arcicella rigui]MEA5140466.1 putative LPS assembly protein LptD [Arcicella rigui]
MCLLLGLLFVNKASSQRLLGGKAYKPESKKSKNITPTDTVRKDTTNLSLAKTIPDSLKKESELTTTVVYTAKDSTIMDTEHQMVYLYGDAKVTYGDISLESDFILLDWAKNEVTAHGTMDSTTHKIKGKPIFKQGNDPYDADEIKYNFKSKKALIKGLITTQGEGFIQGQKVKKDNEDNLYIRNAIYTTCNLEHPHFNIRATKIKVVGKREIVAGPFHFELNEIPLPIGLPFGFFPYKPPQESGTSGIIMPTYGEEPQGRGFFLRDGGYYFAISPNIGLRLTGEIYSKGSFGITANSQYIKRYRYAGTFNVNFRQSNNGDEFNRLTRNDYGIQWSHSPQSRGNSSFSASVNLQSNSNSQYNSLSTSSYLSTALNSSIQYSRNIGQTVRTSVSLQADQNTITKAVNVNTNYTLGLNQFQPFKKKNAVVDRFIDQFRMGLDISGSYGITNQVALTNRSYNNLGYTVYRMIDTLDLDQTKALTVTSSTSTTTNLARDGVIPFNLQTLPDLLKNATFKAQYSIPISLPNIKIGRYINLTPGFSLSGNIYRQKYRYNFKSYNDLAAIYSKDTTAGKGAVQIDTLRGGAFYADYSYAFTMSMNTRLYGTINFKKGRLQGIRHTLSPNISISYTPDFTDPKYGFYQTVQINNRVHTYQKGETIPSSMIGQETLPGDYLNISTFNPTQTNRGSQSGGISFGFQNTLEAKLRAKSDTAQKDFEKINLIDNFSLTGNYNFFATQYKLSNLNFSANSRVKKFDINLGGSLDPYKYVNDGYSTTGRKIDTLLFSLGEGFAKLASFNFALSKSFKPQSANAKKTNANGTEGQMNQINRNINDYVDWTVPWNLQFAVNYNMYRTGLAPATTVMAMTAKGDVKLTEKWNFSISTGYDFVNKGMSLTNISIHRDLHCWEANFDWTPIASPYYGRASTYSFTLRVKSSLLQELKLSRRNTFYDKGGF